MCILIVISHFGFECGTLVLIIAFILLFKKDLNFNFLLKSDDEMLKYQFKGMHFQINKFM